MSTTEATAKLNELFGDNGLNGFIGLGDSIIGLCFVGFIGLGLVSIAGLISHSSLIVLGGFSGISDLVGQISLVSLIGLLSLVSINSIGSFENHSLVSLFIIAIISLVGSSTLVDCRIIVGFISGFVGLGGLISNISLIGFISLIGLSASSAYWLIGFGGFAICSVAAIIAATANLSAVVRKQATCRVAAFFAALWDSDHLAMAGATTTCWLKHTASHRVATLQISASDIVDAATAFYAASSIHVHSFVREKMCWWLALAKKTNVVVDCLFW
jgi:hypothetical protein